MIFTIRKGGHYSEGLSLGGMHSGITKMEFMVTMDSGGLVLPSNPSCTTDWNKLFGFSYGHHRINSVRISWRGINYYMNKSGGIIATSYRIGAYVYCKGILLVQGFAMIRPHVPTYMSIETDGETARFICGGKSVLMSYNISPGVGYILNPYHGGDCPAQSDIKFKFNE